MAPGELWLGIIHTQAPLRSVRCSSDLITAILVSISSTIFFLYQLENLLISLQKGASFLRLRKKNIFFQVSSFTLKKQGVAFVLKLKIWSLVPSKREDKTEIMFVTFWSLVINLQITLYFQRKPHIGSKKILTLLFPTCKMLCKITSLARSSFCHNEDCFMKELFKVFSSVDCWTLRLPIIFLLFTMSVFTH